MHHRGRNQYGPNNRAGEARGFRDRRHVVAAPELLGDIRKLRQRDRTSGSNRPSFADADYYRLNQGRVCEPTAKRHRARRGHRNAGSFEHRNPAVTASHREMRNYPEWLLIYWAGLGGQGRCRHERVGVAERIDERRVSRIPGQMWEFCDPERLA